MLRSMTGFGRYESVLEDMKIMVEMRSVNHRFCEIVLRLPRHLQKQEESLKQVIHNKLHRGRIEVFINLQSDRLTKKKVHIDWDLAQAYLHVTHRLQNELGVTGELKLRDLLFIEDLFQVEEEILDDELLSQFLTDAVLQTTLQLLDMRIEEGKALEEDLIKRINAIRDMVFHLHSYAPQVKDAYLTRLESRIKEILADRTAIEEDRILNEVAFFAEKSDIAEELTRLLSHCDQFIMFINESGPVGRKLDFLVQEMNREVNTIGSKSSDILISKQVVELKGTLEKIREQVQNVE